MVVSQYLVTLSPNPFKASLGNETFFIEGEKQSDKKLYLIFDVDCWPNK